MRCPHLLLIATPGEHPPSTPPVLRRSQDLDAKPTELLIDIDSVPVENQAAASHRVAAHDHLRVLRFTLSTEEQVVADIRAPPFLTEQVRTEDLGVLHALDIGRPALDDRAEPLDLPGGPSPEVIQRCIATETQRPVRRRLAGTRGACDQSVMIQKISRRAPCSCRSLCADGRRENSADVLKDVRSIRYFSCADGKGDATMSHR